MSDESRLNVLEDEQNVDLTLSYSRVSDFDRNGPKALLEKVTKQNKGMGKGSIVDDLLFSKETFNDKYHVSEFKEPTATQGVLAKIILDNYMELPSIEEIFNIIARNELWSNIKKIETLQSKFDDDSFWGYLKEMYSIKDKSIITLTDKMMAQDIVNILKTHQFSKSIFDENLDHYYQYSFKIKIKQFYFRGIIDIVSVDHKKKIVYFKDLKTGSGTAEEFLSSFIKYRYYLQSAVYRLAFEQICKELSLEEYTLGNFEFLFIGLNQRIPVTLVVSEKWNEAALNGFTMNGYTYRGLYELIDEIYFHWQNKIYDLPKEVYVNKGRIVLKDNLISVT